MYSSRKSRIQLDLSIGVEINGHGGRDLGLTKFRKSIRLIIPPQTIVEVHFMGRLIVDHNDVHIAITV